MTFYSFCPTQWIEDMDVANRALRLWLHIIKVVQHWESQSKSKRPKNKYCENLVKCFQTEKPIVPFLEASLVDIFHTLMKMIVKAEVLDEVCGDNVSSFKLVKIDLAKSENVVHHELVKLPTATKALLKSLALPVNKKP